MPIPFHALDTYTSVNTWFETESTKPLLSICDLKIWLYLFQFYEVTSLSGNECNGDHHIMQNR